jgi:hypothetical protein
MKVSRTPEKRGGGNRTLVYVSLVFAVVIIGVVVTYFTTGFNLPSATGDQSELASAPNTPHTSSLASLPQVAPTPLPPPAATPEPTVGLKLLEPGSGPLAGRVPDVKFGEVLAEGLVQVELPGNNAAKTWYTYQVDTATRDITLFFALYHGSSNTMVRTVKIEGYAQGQELENAELTLFYPEGPQRVLTFNRGQGTITLAQQYRQPYGPSIFSPELRVALVNHGIELRDDTGNIKAELQLDLTGLSDSEGMVFQQVAPEVVEDALSEIQGLVNQIEDKRVR